MFDPKSQAESFFEHVHVIPASGVVQQDEVRALCAQNTCGFYGRNWCCPPAVAPLDEWKKRFEPFDTLVPTSAGLYLSCYPAVHGLRGAMHGGFPFTHFFFHPMGLAKEHHECY